MKHHGSVETSRAAHLSAASAGSATVQHRTKLTPFWSTVQADITRFREEDGSLRTVVRGLLSQGFQALFVYRVFRWFYERNIPTQPVRFIVERFTEITTGISLPAQARIGKGLRIHHFGGIIVHSDAIIGENCTLYHGVTLGDLGGWGGVPHVGSHVMIGAGAKLLGGIEVGDGSLIGANSVVRSSVPPGCLAVGAPAKIKKRVRDNEQNASEADDNHEDGTREKCLS